MLRSPRVSLFLLGLTLAANPACSPLSTQTTPMHRRGQIDLKPCRLPNYDREVLCGKHQVFEDRTAKSGRKITLNIVVLPALVRTPAPDPVFFLAGGPGQGAARIAGAGPDPLMQSLRRARDLVFVDQRGSGDSHRLQCRFSLSYPTVQSYFADLFPLDEIRRCRDVLQKSADLKFYTTPVAVEDVEEIRAALGYEKINLYGISYGSQAALHYLRQYPARVRSLALAGVATAEMKLPLHFAQGAQRALDSLIEDCAADSQCRSAFPNLKYEFAAVLGAFDNGPVHFELPHPVSKTVQSVSLSRGIFVERLRFLLYDPAAASVIPLLIERAARGDWSTFGKAALASRIPPTHSVALGLYLTVTCAESVPTISEDDIASETKGTFLGEYRTRRHQQACRDWPRAAVPTEYFQPVKADVPVLMISGEHDPATPARFAQALTPSLPYSRHVILRQTPHVYGSDCARAMIIEFIIKGSAGEIDTRCAAHLRRPPFPSRLPGRFDR